MIAGYHQGGQRQVDMQMWNWKGIDIVNAHEHSPNVQRHGMEQASKALANGEIDPLPLYSAIYPLKELGEALDTTRDKPGDFVKALIRYT